MSGGPLAIRMSGFPSCCGLRLKGMLDDLMNADDEAPPPRPARKSRALPLLRDLLIAAVVLLLVQAFVRQFVAAPIQVGTRAMSPALQRGTIAMMRPGDEPTRGQVIVFRTPDAWRSDQGADPSAVVRALRWVGVLRPPAGEVSVGRVLGVPGDELQCCSADGKLVINSVPVRYAAGETTARFRLLLGRDRFFVVGDNPGSSVDSRCYLHSLGPDALVARSDIEGRLTTRVWPPPRWGSIVTPYIYTGVPAPGDPPAEAIVESGKDAPC